MDLGWNLGLQIIEQRLHALGQVLMRGVCKLEIHGLDMPVRKQLNQSPSRNIACRHPFGQAREARAFDCCLAQRGDGVQ